MNDFQAVSLLKPLNFLVTINPGSTTVQNAVAYYEVVLPSGRSVAFTQTLDISNVQPVVDIASTVIIGQLLQLEGLSQPVWWGGGHQVIVHESCVMADIGVQS